MTNPIRRSAVCVTALALATLALSSCSLDSGDDQKTFTFTYSTSSNLESPYEQLATLYMAENPGVRITTNATPADSYGETIRSQLQAGNASDVLLASPGSGESSSIIPLAKAGYLEPLGDVARALVPLGSDASFIVGDDIFGQPVDFTVGAMVTNLDAAESVGITNFPSTVDDFYAACRTAADQGKAFVALAGAAGSSAGYTALAIAASRVYVRMPSWDAQRAAGEVTFSGTEGWRTTLETIVGMKDARCFQAGAEGAGLDAISNGLVLGRAIGAFTPSGAATELSQAVGPSARFAIEAFPAEKGSKPYVIASSSDALAINAASTKKTAARAFVDWMAGDEAQQHYFELSGQLPVSTYTSLDLSDTPYAPIARQLATGGYATAPYALWPNPSVYEALSNGVQGLLTGQRDVDRVLADMDRAWDS